VRKLFVSYARENKADVDQLVEHLRTMGYDTWVDAALRGGQDWWDEILDRIADTDVVIAIYSSAALNSTACGREFEWATALGKPVIPVAVEPPPPALPSRFARRQIIDYSQPAQRDRAALQLQGALATLPPAPPPPDPLPDPPAAPLSYLTDIIDLITQANPLDHDQQHQILHQLEPALASFDPLERRGGHDILERFSTRHDLYADVDRAITRLRQLPNQPAPVDSEPPTPSTVGTTEQSEIQIDAREPIAATTPGPLSSPAATDDAELTHEDKPARESDDVAADFAGTSAPGANADTRETANLTRVTGSDAQAGPRLADEPVSSLKSFAQSDEHRSDVAKRQPRLSRRTAIAVAAGALVVVVAVVVGIVVGNQSSSGGGVAPTGDPLQRLLSAVPSGDHCSSDSGLTFYDALAKVSCKPGANELSQLGYALYPDLDRLGKYLNTTPADGFLPCPGTGQAGPQSWQHGKIECWVIGSTGWVAWSIDSQLVLGVAVGLNGAGLDAVYRWWTTRYQWHSSTAAQRSTGRGQTRASTCFRTAETSPHPVRPRRRGEKK